MKHLKMLCLAAIAALAAMALAGAGSASATVLCKTTTTPCSSPYGKGSIFVPSLASGSSNVLEASFEEGGEEFVLQTCLQTKVKVEIENSGGSTSTVSGPVRELVGGSCAYPMTTLKAGSLEIHHISGTDNGTVTGSFTEVTVNSALFGSCVYGVGTGNDFGTLFGGESPTLKVNGIVKKTGGSIICPSEARWTGEYKVTEPTPLYVEPS